MFRRRLIVLLVLSSVLSSVGVHPGVDVHLHYAEPCRFGHPVVRHGDGTRGWRSHRRRLWRRRRRNPIREKRRSGHLERRWDGNQHPHPNSRPASPCHGLGHRRRRGHRGEQQDNRSQQRNRLFPHFRQHFGHPFAKLTSSDGYVVAYGVQNSSTVVGLEGSCVRRSRCPSGHLDEGGFDLGSRGTPNLPGPRQQRFSRPESGQRHQLRRHRGGLVQCACHRWQRQPISGRGHIDKQRVRLGGQ